MLITRKSIVVHEFLARVCCGGVFWVSVPSDVVGCGSVDFCTCLYVCISSAVCDFLISAVWRNLTNKGCASSSVWDWVKREVKLLKCWSRLLVIRAWAVAELLSGLDVSRMTELRLLMMIDQVGQARHGNNPLKSGTGTGDCQPGSSSSYHTRSLCRGWNRLWILSANSDRTAEHASDCSEVCAESVDPGSERQSSSDLSGTEGNCDKRSHTPLERHHRRWKHRLCLRPREKTAIFAMEESWVSKTQKSTYAKKQIEEGADLFLSPRGDRTPGIRPTWNDGQCTLLLWCSKKVTWKCAAQEATEMVKPEHHYPPRQCPAHRSFKISQFLAKNNMTLIPIPHTHTIWPPVTFSSSPSWSFGWRVEDSTPLKRFKMNHSGYLAQFQKGTSSDASASKHGRKAGTAIFVQKGSTLKVMEEFNIQGKQTSFYKYCPGTFGYILVFSVS